MGVPQGTEVPAERLADLSDFAASAAAIVVTAVDSSFWVVVSKFGDTIQRLEDRFRDLRRTEQTLENGLELPP